MAEMTTMEDLPRWLRNWELGRTIPIQGFFASRVVFYPGSGTDGQPVQFFGSRHQAHCFVYADYGITRDGVLQELGVDGHPFAGYQRIGHTDLRERDLTPNGWVAHIQPDHARRGPLDVDTQPYAFVEILERLPEFNDTHGPQRLAILFLCTDGVAAYDALFCQVNSTAPFAVVLQDHGFGGNWTTFGHGGQLESLAVDTGRLPEFLLVAENTLAWAGYDAIDGAVAGGGGMWGYNGQLWRRAQVDIFGGPMPNPRPPSPPTQDPPVVAEEGQGPSAQELFFDSIAAAPAANELIAQVVALCDHLDAEVHYTYTDGADLRVRVHRNAPQPLTQNVVTLNWQPQSGRFSCRVLLAAGECVQLGMPADQVHQNAAGQPLPTRLTAVPGQDNAALLGVIGQCIAQFRGV